MTASPCPANCGHTRDPGKYLCRTCWFQLTATARTRLSQRGPLAVPRLQALLDQIHAGVPLPDIRIA